VINHNLLYECVCGQIELGLWPQLTIGV